MAIALPSKAGGVLPEYAATSITFNRAIQNVEGEMVATFTANIAYSRTDYLVQDGKKVGIVSTGNPGVMPGPSNQDLYGNIFFDVAKTLALFGTVPAEGVVLGETIAAMADEQIRLDLIARGILTA